MSYKISINPIVNLNPVSSQWHVKICIRYGRTDYVIPSNFSL
jgi:hypothetical protein